MTKLKKALTILLVFIMILTISPIQANAAKKVKLNKSKLSLYVGKSYTLKLKNIKNKIKIKWKSSKKSVATVSSKGKVKAKKKGSCKITAKVGKKKYVCKVTVKKKISSSTSISTTEPTDKPPAKPTPTPIAEPTPTPTEVTSIVLTHSNLEITRGQQATIGAIVLPSNIADYKIVWSSSDSTIAEVDQNGCITANKMGECDIIASIKDKKGICHLTIKGTPSDLTTCVGETVSSISHGSITNNDRVHAIVTLFKNEINISDAENGKINMKITFKVENSSTSKKATIPIFCFLSYDQGNTSSLVYGKWTNYYIEPGEEEYYTLNLTNLEPRNYHIVFSDTDDWWF